MRIEQSTTAYTEGADWTSKLDGAALVLIFWNCRQQTSASDLADASCEQL